MGDRSLLGVADVADDELARMVAELLGQPHAELVDVTVEPVRYDVASITTVARSWVSGTARTPGGEKPFRLFVKHVQAWHHSPFFQLVPDHLRETAAASYPWRIEAAVYESGLAGHLPDGLSMPRSLGVFWLPEDQVVVWLEAVAHEEPPWDPNRFERVAHLLGRLSGCAALDERGEVADFPWRTADYVRGRLAAQVLPAVADDTTWESPVVAEAFGDHLRDRLRIACAAAASYAEELDALPWFVSHGDASPGNLLPGREPGGVVLVDFGFWMPKPVGFDLGQLVGGDVQLGRVPALPLDELDERCVAAYTRGLAAEGAQVDLAVVRRAHALQLFLFAGASSLPDPGMSLEVTRARAALARHSLDLLDRTG
jgi:hypothetical protein